MQVTSKKLYVTFLGGELEVTDGLFIYMEKNKTTQLSHEKKKTLRWASSEKASRSGDFVERTESTSHEFS